MDLFNLFVFGGGVDFVVGWDEGKIDEHKGYKH